MSLFSAHPFLDLGHQLEAAFEALTGGHLVGSQLIGAKEIHTLLLGRLVQHIESESDRSLALQMLEVGLEYCPEANHEDLMDAALLIFEEKVIKVGLL